MVDTFLKNGTTPFCTILGVVVSFPTRIRVYPNIIGMITPRTPATPTRRINVNMAHTTARNLSKIRMITMRKPVVNGIDNVSTILQLAPFDLLSISELTVIPVTMKFTVSEEIMSQIIRFAMKKN